ncbi:MAG: glycine dehydrogenase (aminomethyl-transferring) [Gammaproteobacteria bacterium GWF2_41_13]|nr:MAG: glycine dehydrogenase (aminomethyl-transferring) [Gammaproteobacteria bacterium GWF2_41_13]
MPFIPHTEKDVHAMLESIGIRSINELFDEIPPELLIDQLPAIPKALNEMQIARLMKDRAKQDENTLCFIGAGAYEHHIPAAVWDIAGRVEYMTAYTPYQPEASQGELQLLYEYQTMMASLTGMDASNASLYDGASAVAEAILMAIRSNRQCQSKRVVIPTTLNPLYRKAIQAIVSKQSVELIEIPFDEKTGRITVEAIDKIVNQEFAALVIPQPNFFGLLGDVDALTDWAHQRQALAIAVVNPMTLALLKEPGLWGEKGADIACGEAQPFGIPLSSGGPYLGFLCCKNEYIRQMPGRIVGQTTDADGKIGYILTLQAREQHIRRSKATSNICSNQGLMAVAATIYLSLLGPKGLKRVAAASHQKTMLLAEKATKLKGVEVLFHGHYFHEIVLQLPQPAEPIIQEMACYQIAPGLALGEFYPGMDNALLVCCTETKTEEDINKYIECLKQALKNKAIKK